MSAGYCPACNHRVEQCGCQYAVYRANGVFRQAQAQQDALYASLREWLPSGANEGRLFGLARGDGDPSKLPVGHDEPDELDAARKRIAELEVESKARSVSEAAINCGLLVARNLDLGARANRLSDEAGALRTERDELLRENAVLRRENERLERKAGKR